MPDASQAERIAQLISEITALEAANAPNASNTPEHQRVLLAAKIARLQVRELQIAEYGIDAPPHMVMERDDLLGEIAQLRTRLAL